MTHYDVFNGDADGICALQQLRLARPRTSTLVTGVKRDNALLARVNAGEGDTVTVLDVSYRRNGDDVERLLAAGARIRYIDHHDPGAVADHPRLETHIDLPLIHIPEPTRPLSTSYAYTCLNNTTSTLPYVYSCFRTI